MADVFVSYSRKDQTVAMKLVERLRADGLDVWIDTGLGVGGEWRLTLEHQLQAARCVVVLWSKSSVTSPFVLDEAARGLAQGRLVPIFLDDTPPPLGFGQTQSGNLSAWKPGTSEVPLSRILAAIDTILQSGQASAPTPSEPSVFGEWFEPTPSAPARRPIAPQPERPRAPPTKPLLRRKAASKSPPTPEPSSTPAQRALTSDTMHEMAKILRQAPGRVDVVTLKGQPEREKFAVNILTAFIMARWKADVRIEDTVFVGDAPGVLLVPRGNPDSHPIVIRALEVAGIPWSYTLLGLDPRQPRPLQPLDCSVTVLFVGGAPNAPRLFRTEI